MACDSLALRQRKGREQAAHVFDNGNEHGAALRDFVGGEEDDATVSIHGASVPASDELIGVLSAKSVELLMVFIDDKLSDRLPFQRIPISVIAQCEVARSGLVV